MEDQLRKLNSTTNYRKKSLDKNKFNSARKIVWDIFVIAQGLRTWKELIIEQITSNT